MLFRSIFTEPKLFNAASSVPGGPQRQYQTTVLYLWDLAFNRQSFGRAAAVAWILFLIIVAVGLINFAISRTIAGAETRVARRRGLRKADATARAVAPSAGAALAAAAEREVL